MREVSLCWASKCQGKSPARPKIGPDEPFWRNGLVFVAGVHSSESVRGTDASCFAWPWTGVSKRSPRSCSTVGNAGSAATCEAARARSSVGLFVPAAEVTGVNKRV